MEEVSLLSIYEKFYNENLIELAGRCCEEYGIQETAGDYELSCPYLDVYVMMVFENLLQQGIIEDMYLEDNQILVDDLF